MTSLPVSRHPPRPTLISENTRKGPDSSVLKMLRGNEAQMCLRCHEEQKSDFSRPFRHKVLEGVMNCSECHAGKVWTVGSR